jgi:hypothetical protein
VKNGDLTVSGNDIALGGLYLVEGNVIVQGNNISMLETTVVAMGRIEINTNAVPYSPWIPSGTVPPEVPGAFPWGLVLYSELDAVDKCNHSDPNTGILLKGNVPSGEGVFYAPKSIISLDNQAGYIKGAIFGYTVSIKGQSWTIDKYRPDLGTLGGLERINLVR